MAIADHQRDAGRLFLAAGPACSEATDSAASSERMFSAAWAPIASDTMPTRTAATASGAAGDAKLSHIHQLILSIVQRTRG